MPEIITQKLSTAELQKLIPLIEQTRFSYKLDKFSDASSKEVLKSVQRARGEIAQKMARVSPTAKFTEVLKRERLEALSEELQHLTLAAQSQIVGGITKATEIAGKAAYTAQNNILSFGGLVPHFNPVTLSAAQLHSMVTKMPIGGRQLNEWVQRTFKTDIQEGIKSELLTGMLKGESYRDMTKRFGDKVFDGLSQDMETLTKSYVQSVNIQALDDVAKANKDIVRGWKWNSVCENRTCLACMSLDSRDEVYPLGEGPTMPLHPRCRCFKEIITKTFREMGVDVDEIEKAYRPYTIRGTVDPITGKITPGKIGVGGGKVIETGRFLGTYEDFLKGQSIAVQRQILGPSRLELWKAGKVKLMDFADAKGNVHLLTELRGIETTKVARLLGDITPGMPAKSADDILKHYRKSEKATFIEGKSAQELKEDVSDRLGKKMYTLKSNDMDDFIRPLSNRIATENMVLADYKVASGNIIRQWAATSGDSSPHSIAMQLAAQKEFGLKGTSLWWKKEALAEAKILFKKHEIPMRRFLREMYNDTQKHLAKRGLKTVRVVRGYKGDIGIKPSTIANKMSKGDVQLQPMSSFSGHLNTAKTFAGQPIEGSPSSLIFVEVPIERVLSIPVTGYGCKAEFEYVILGSQRVKGEKALYSMITKKQNLTWDSLFGKKSSFMRQEIYIDVNDNIIKEIFKRTK